VTETIVQRFESVWGPGERLFVSEAPYRVSPLGAHTDHQDGLVLGMTTRARLRIAFRRRDDGRVRVRSRDFPGTPEWSIGEPLRPTGDFADYLRGVSVAVAEKGPITTGCDAWIEGDLRPGGVASSAALAVAWLGALLHLEGRDMNPRDRMRLVVDAERRFAGVEVGLLDPAVILFGGIGKVVYLDCLDGVPKSYAVPKRCPPFEAVLVDSGVVRDLRVSPYNARVEECRSVARALGVEGERPTLRPIGYEDFRRQRSRLDPVAAKRADHVLSENKRVRNGLTSLSQGDLAAFGALMNQSGRSMIDFFGAGTPETSFLLDLLQNDADVVGATLSGAGFGGALLAFMRPGTAAAMAERVRPAYAAKFADAAGRMTTTTVPLGGETRVDSA